MTEQEEFEFRQRLEQEQAAQQASARTGTDTQVNPLYGVVGGAFAGQAIGPAANKAAESFQKNRAARKSASVPTASGAAPAGGLVPTPDQHTRIIQGGVDETGTTGRARQQGYNERTAAQSLERQAAEKNMQDLARRRIITGESPLTKIAAPTSTPSGIIVPGSAVYEAPAAAPVAKPPTMASRIGASFPQPIQKLGSAIGGFGQDLGAAIGGAAQAGVTPYIGRALAGAGAGFQGADVYNRLQQGDVPGAAISGLGTLGSLAAFVPTPVTRVGGTAVGVGAELLNQYLDSLKQKVNTMGQPPQQQAPQQQPMPQMARGGLVHLKKGGQPELGEARAYEPSYSEKIRDYAAKFMSPEQADRLFGGPRASLVDEINPIGAALRAPGVIADAAKGFVRAGKEGDYLAGMGNYLVGAANVAPVIGPAARGAAKLGPKAAEMAENYLTKIGGIQNIVPPSNRAVTSTNVGKAFDPRFDPRVLEQAKLKNLTTNVEKYQPSAAPKVSLPDFEGHPFITSMSDRTAAGGHLVGVNDVNLNRPVDLMGGQDFMFNNPGQVWASAPNPIKQLMRQAEGLKDFTGKDPLYIPWRMAPTGSDFAHMTGETMLSHADVALSRSDKAMLNKAIKDIIPDWKGLGAPESLSQFRNASSSARKNIQFMIDRDFRDKGALSIGEARLAIADPTQLSAPEGGIQNVGRIFAEKPIIQNSGHFSYPQGAPGEGLGVIDTPHNVFELMPKVVKQRGIVDPRSPSQQDIRALQMKPYSGIIDDKLLKSLGYKTGGEVEGYQAGGLAKRAHSQHKKVAQALEEYLKGNISQADRIKIVDEFLPIRKRSELPPEYTDEQIINALLSNKQPKALVEVPAGMRVGNRLDIPAYTQHGVYVDTTHDLAKGNAPISYNRTGHLKDVEFSSKPNQAVRVGLGTKEQALTPMGAEMGAAKSPFALIKGTNVGTKDDEVRRMMAEMLNDPSYVQIGMDPRRGSQFFNKETGMPVFAAEEKFQAGPLVIVPRRGLEETSLDDPRLDLSDFVGKKYKKGGLATLKNKKK
jgi:hypothetical protein